jgi:hypothetical protein
MAYPIINMKLKILPKRRKRRKRKRRRRIS